MGNDVDPQVQRILDANALGKSAREKMAAGDLHGATQDRLRAVDLFGPRSPEAAGQLSIAAGLQAQAGNYDRAEALARESGHAGEFFKEQSERQIDAIRRARRG